MSTIQVINAKHPSSASNNLVLDNAGNAAFAGTAAMASSFLRNRIINGAMEIDQRNAGASASLTAGVLTYFIDRWYGFQLGATVTGQRVSSGLAAFPSAARLTGASGNTLAEITQRIESVNIADLAGQTVTISFFCAGTGVNNVNVFSLYPNSTDNYSSFTLVSANNVSITSTMTRYSVSVTLPNQVANGYLVGFQFPSGLGAGQIFTLTGVQVEAGNIATPFERRQFGQELALCQRYFFKSFNLNTVPGTIGAASHRGLLSTSSFRASHSFLYPVTMRTSPTITFYNPNTGVAGSAYNEDIGTNPSVTPFIVSQVGLSGIDISPSASFGNCILVTFVASAEL